MLRFAPVVLLLVIALLLEMTAARIPAAARAEATPVPTDGDFAALVDIGGRSLYLECRGQGSPTVILEAGFRNNAQIWQETLPGAGPAVFADVARFTRVCAYDRPGTILDADHLSRSDPVPMPRQAEAVVADLHAMLRTANIPGPYVLVAHSLGGLFVRLYASTYPEDVAGIVLVDAWSEELPRLLGPDQWDAYAALAAPPPPGLEGYPELEQIDFAVASATLEAATTAHPLRPMPLVVISRGKPVALPPDVPAAFSPAAFEQAWASGQALLAQSLPAARQIFATESDHYVQLEQPHLVIDAVRAVVAAVRDPDTWSAAASPVP